MHTCDCKFLEKATHIKYLGVIIDENINWKPHIDYLAKKLRYVVLILSKIRGVANLKLRKIIYFALFQSRLQYCLSVFGGTYKTTLKPLQTLQKKAIRLITNSERFSHTAPLFSETKILTLGQLYIFRCVKYYIRKPNFVKTKTGYSNRLQKVYPLDNFIPKTAKADTLYRVKIISLLNTLPSEVLRNCKKLKPYLIAHVRG